MIYTLIVEDEEPAATRLIRLLKNLDEDIEIAAVTDTVESAVKWLNNHKQPDLLILDIQLGDGLSFDIFRKVKVDSYVIFTTAYDEYAVRAFETNSIDYLLKPVDEGKLARSLEKYRKYSGNIGPDLDNLIETIEKRKEKYKKRFVVTVASRIRVIETPEIAYFYSKDKNTFLCTRDNHHYPLESSLDNIAEIIDPGLFFRISRQFIVSYRNILKIDILSKSRIRIITDPPSEEEMLVSTTRTSEFRNWLDR